MDQNKFTMIFKLVPSEVVFESPTSKAIEATSQADANTVEFRFRAYMQEYEAVRSEQRERLNGSDRTAYFAVLIVLAMLAGILSISQTSPDGRMIGILLLITPALTTPLIYMSLVHQIMVVRLGVYLYRDLRRKVIRITKEPNLWRWERFHVEESTRTVFRLAGVLRRFFYVFFPSIPTIAFFFVQKGPMTRPEWLLVILDSLLIFFTIVVVLHDVMVFANALPPSYGYGRRPRPLGA